MRVGFQKKSIGELIFIVAEFTKSLASTRITVLVRKSHQKNSSARRMILTSSDVAKNWCLEFWIRLYKL